MGSSFGLRDGCSVVGLQRVSGLLSRLMLGTIILSGLCGQAQAQDFLTRGGAAPAGGDLCDATNLAPCFQRVAQDQAGMVRSLFHLKPKALPAILGVAAATGLALHFDRPMSRTLMTLPDHPTQINHAADVAGVYGPFAASGVMYLAGNAFHNDRVRETGLLATEAMVDAALVGQSLKFVVNRQSPGTGPGAAQFYAQGLPRGGSMPSAHALNVWAFARVVAGESNSKWVGVLAYSLATTVSFSRTMTGAHSVSDVIVGGALGYGIGEYVLRRRGSEGRARHHRIPHGGDLSMVRDERDELPPLLLTQPAPEKSELITIASSENVTP
jgi:hypothetical protein